jgi:pimeloyl-ACP methyl ester carboxylesterase
MKIIFVVLLFAHLSVSAQNKIKKVLVKGTGIPMVILSDGPDDMSSLSVLADTLSHKYKVICIQHYNVQFADEGIAFPKNYSVKTESEGIRYTLDSMKIDDPVVIIGYSYGGVIGFDFAIRYPKRVRSMILIEPPLFELARAKNESPVGMKNLLDVTKELTPEAEITETQVERYRHAFLADDTLSTRRFPQWSTWVKNKNRMRGLSIMGKYKVNFDKFHEFPKPVLVMTGALTPPFLKRIDDLLRKQFVFGKAVTIQCGHAIPMDASKDLTKSILAFIQ